MKVHVLVFTYAEKYEGSKTQCYIQGVFSSKELAENYKQKIIEDEIRRKMSEDPDFGHVWPENNRKIRNQQLQVVDFELKAEQESQPQEDVTQKLQNIADLHQKGVLTDEEFQKLKARFLAKL